MAIDHLHKFTVALVAVVVVLEAARTAGQQIPACASKLVPCANYLNSANPPESCCGPLKEAVNKELPCLCSLLNSPDLLKAFNLNLTQVLQLPKNCGIKSDQSICSKSSSATPPSAVPTPPAGSGGRSSSGRNSSSGGSSAKKEDSGALSGVNWIGYPLFISLLLFGWSVMAL